MRSDLPLVADRDTIADRWPRFLEEMVRSTSYNAIVSIPVRLARGVGGAMDVYFTDPPAASGSTSTTASWWRRTSPTG